MNKIKQLVTLIIIVFLLLLLPVVFLYADTLYLKDGSVIEGKIINVTEHNVTIENNLGTLIINKDNIEKIEFTEVEEEKTEEEKLREEIKEKLKELGIEEDVIIIIVSSDETKDDDDDEDDDTNNYNNNETNDYDNNDNNVNNDAVNNENNDENNNNVDDDDENENYNNNDTNNYDNNDDDDEEEEENNEWDWANEDNDIDPFYKPKYALSLGLFTFTNLDYDFIYNSHFGLSFRYIDLNGWYSVNCDFSMGTQEAFSMAFGGAFRAPLRLSPSLGGAFHFTIVDLYSTEIISFSISAGAEIFYTDYISTLLYIRKHFILDEGYGNYEFIDNFEIGLSFYVNIVGVKPKEHHTTIEISF